MTNCIPAILVTALSISAGFAFWFMFQNRGNKEIIFATTTMTGAMIFYLLQVFLGFSEDKRSTSFAIEITVDRSTNFIGAHVYSLQQSMRAHAEVEAVRKLTEAQPSLIEDQEETVRRDFIILSTLDWLASEEFDWRSQSKVLTTTWGNITRKGRTSEPAKSEVLKEDDVKKALAKAGNVFTEHFAMRTFKEIILPKGSEFRVASNTVTIRHPVFDLKFEFGISPEMISNVDPRTDRMEVLPNGKPRFSTYVYEATVTTILNKYRAGDVNRPLIEAWFTKLQTDIRDWFEIRVRKKGLDKIPIGSVAAPD